MGKDAGGTVGLAILFGVALAIVATIFTMQQSGALAFGQKLQVSVHYDLAAVPAAKAGNPAL